MKMFVCLYLLKQRKSGWRNRKTSLIEQSDEYYFERSALLFDAVFKYYATGQLHRPLDVCTHEYSQVKD